MLKQVDCLRCARAYFYSSNIFILKSTNVFVFYSYIIYNRLPIYIAPLFLLVQVSFIIK